MKCKICEKFFVLETTFLNLFTFKEICPDCEELFKPIPKLEVIPVDQGEIRYYYLYDDLSINKKQKDYLETNIKYLLKYIENESYHTLIILDDQTYHSLKTDLKLLIYYSPLLLVSVCRYSLENFVFF